MIGLLTIGFASAIGTEQVQALLEYRSSDSRDLLADYSGLLSGCIITTIYLLIRRRK
jgi:VanZ family protein